VGVSAARLSPLVPNSHWSLIPFAHKPQVLATAKSILKVLHSLVSRVMIKWGHSHSGAVQHLYRINRPGPGARSKAAWRGTADSPGADYTRDCLLIRRSERVFWLCAPTRSVASLEIRRRDAAAVQGSPSRSYKEPLRRQLGSCARLRGGGCPGQIERGG
jgi:hypothetical protein